MKKIQITETKRQQINAAFTEANGRAKANTLRGGDAFEMADRAERQLEARGLPKSKRKGAIASYFPSGPSASYDYRMKSTAFTIVRGTEGWALASVEKIDVYPKTKGGLKLTITQEQAAYITAHALDGLTVKRAA